MASSSSVLLSSASTMRTPLSGSQPHQAQASQYSSSGSDHFVVGEGTNQKMRSTFGAVISSPTPSYPISAPPGSQRHPNDVARSSYTNDSHFSVGGGAPQKVHSTFGATISSSTPSSYSNPPVRSQCHPNEALPPSHPSDSHFFVGGEAPQTYQFRGSTFGPGIKSYSSPSSSSSNSPLPFSAASSTYSSSYVSKTSPHKASTFGTGIASSMPSTTASPFQEGSAPAGSQAHPGKKGDSSGSHFKVGQG